jgi:hypothetical protein
VLGSEIIRKFIRNLPSARILFAEIQLVADKHNNNFRFSVLFDFIEPPLHADEGFLICDIVDDKSSDRLTVMGASDGSKPLLTSGIPNLSLNGTSSFQRHGLCGKLYTDGRLVCPWKCVSNISTEQMCFAHVTITDQNNYAKGG